MKTADAFIYLNRARELGIVPNFWLTQEYLEYQNDARLKMNGHAIWIQEEDKAIFPPLPMNRPLGNRDGFPMIEVWSDFPNYTVGEPVRFLDWEYTYKADNFRDLSGGQWATFRKNIRKWPRHNPCHSETRSQPRYTDVVRLLLEWLEARPDAKIEDDQTMIRFVTQGRHRSFLLRDGELVGINVWDVYDSQYIMYRYCVAKPDEPFLDEFLRSLFYQSVPGKTVIDGGVLGNAGLERFKDKLNPYSKRPVYSRRIVQGGESEWLGARTG